MTALAWPNSVHVSHSQSCCTLYRAGRPHLYPAVQTLLSVPVILEASDGQQIHHKLLGADVQRLSRELVVRQGHDQLPASALSLPFQLLFCPWLLPIILLFYTTYHSGQRDMWRRRRVPKACHTYPQPVGQRHHLGCDSFGILLPDGIQDDVGQEVVTFLCIKHLFPGQREAQESHLCEEERIAVSKAVNS